MEIIFINQNEIFNEIQNAIKNPPKFAIVNYTEKQVNYGFDSKPNFEYCEKNNIPCVDIRRRGGAFAVNKGDVGFGYVGVGLDNGVGELLYYEFEKYLKKKGLNAFATDNDILIDGYKVFGWASVFYEKENIIFISCHFTLSVDIDFIKNVCTKPMNKTPKGLEEFGITREEIISFIQNIVERYNKGERYALQ